MMRDGDPARPQMPRPVKAVLAALSALVLGSFGWVVFALEEDSRRQRHFAVTECLMHDGYGIWTKSSPITLRAFCADAALYVDRLREIKSKMLKAD